LTAPVALLHRLKLVENAQALQSDLALASGTLTAFPPSSAWQPERSRVAADQDYGVGYPARDAILTIGLADSRRIGGIVGFPGFAWQGRRPNRSR